MSSAAYLALLAAQSVDWNMLVDLAVQQALHGWTVVIGGTYSIPFDNFTHPVALRTDRGLYRDLTAVTMGTTILVAQASLVDVESAGGWFYDPAVQLLYAKLPGLENPDVVQAGQANLMRAYFTVHVAAKPADFPGRPPYDAQVDGQQLPTYQASRPDPVTGITVNQTGSLTLVNADGFWDYPAKAWLWLNAVITFRAGGRDVSLPIGTPMAFTDYEVVALMQGIKPITAGDETATLDLRAYTNATDRAFPKRTWADEDVSVRAGGPVFPAGNGGNYAAMFWGTVYDVPLTFMNVDVNKNRYMACDPVQHFNPTLLAVRAVNRSTSIVTALVNGVDYSTGFGQNSMIEIGAVAWPDSDYDFFADLSDAATGTGPAMVAAILAECEVPALSIDGTSFTTAAAACPQAVGYYAPGGALDAASRVIGTDIIMLAQRSLFCTFALLQNGLYTATPWDPSYNLAGLSTITDDDPVTVAPPSGSSTVRPVPGVRVRYAHVVSADTWSAVLAMPGEAQVRLASTEAMTLDSCLITDADALVLAQRMQMLVSTPTLELDIDLGSKGMAVALGDKVRITRSRGASLVGTLDTVMETESFSRRFGEMTAQITVGDMRGLGTAVKRYADPAAIAGLTYATASQAQRLQYGFYGDPVTGFAATADPNSYQNVRYW